MLSVIALLLFVVTPTCPANKVEVHGLARFSGTLTVYPSDGTPEIATPLVQGKKWSVCVPPTPEPAKSTQGFYVPWFMEVHFTYTPDTKRKIAGFVPSKHERWSVKKGAKSVSEDEVVTDGVLR